jgi:acetyl-CoA C-acetyltransferase
MRTGYRLGNATLHDGMYRDGFQCPLADQLMGRTAETLAEKYAIGREEQDTFAIGSQRKAGLAWESGWFEAEVAPVAVGEKTVAKDEHLRPDTTLDGLRKLAPVFKEGGTVTAGNASGITDGAAALLLCSEGFLKSSGFEPLARFEDHASAGVDPRVMGIGPVPSTRALLERTKRKIGDFDLIELNEAFAAQVLACQRELKFDTQKLNVHGGAIALGHPIGCTGARIAVTLLHALRTRGARTGLATLCISGGLGLAASFNRD